VLESLNGKLDGTSLRVPVPDGSITDLVAVLKTSASVADINAAYQEAASTGPMKAVLEYSDAPLVSTDIVGNPNSCIFDSQLTMSQGTLVKVLGWYDNEWGYSNRLVDVAVLVGSANKR
jgi:glyceraldehyde 3-phosphate dehydrogenase (phosphorylating)